MNVCVFTHGKMDSQSKARHIQRQTKRSNAIPMLQYKMVSHFILSPSVPFGLLRKFVTVCALSPYFVRGALVSEKTYVVHSFPRLGFTCFIRPIHVFIHGNRWQHTLLPSLFLMLNTTPHTLTPHSLPSGSRFLISLFIHPLPRIGRAGYSHCDCDHPHSSGTRDRV